MVSLQPGPGSLEAGPVSEHEPVSFFSMLERFLSHVDLKLNFHKDV